MNKNNNTQKYFKRETYILRLYDKKGNLDNQKDEITQYIRRIDEMRIINSFYEEDEKGNYLEFEVQSNFPNPLNSITDINRSFSHLKIEFLTKWN